LFVFQRIQTCSKSQAASYSVSTSDKAAKTYGYPSPESVAVVKNAWSYISTPPYFSLAFTETASRLLCRLMIITITIIIPELTMHISLFHRAFFNSIMDKTPTHALFTQNYINLACWFY